MQTAQAECKVQVHRRGCLNRQHALCALGTADSLAGDAPAARSVTSMLAGMDSMLMRGPAAAETASVSMSVYHSLGRGSFSVTAYSVPGTSQRSACVHNHR